MGWEKFRVKIKSPSHFPKTMSEEVLVMSYGGGNNSPHN